MRGVKGKVFLVVMALMLAGVGASAKDEKPKKPKLELRAAPRMASSPASIYFTAELQGGDDIEEFHCPSLEWDWDDGAKSTHEADCPSFEPGMTIERRFTAEHVFAHQGMYEVKVTMRRAERVIASGRVQVTVRAGLGDIPDSER